MIEFTVKYNPESGRVSVNGPIYDLMTYINVMNMAEKAVLERLAEEMHRQMSPIKQPDKQIVVPK